MVFDRQCNQVIAETSRLLTNSGLTVMESFDLQVARANHTGSTCPHHGTEQCSCQLAILLVYGEDTYPASLMLHGFDNVTEISLIEMPGQKVSLDVKEKINSALVPGYFIFINHGSIISAAENG